MVIKKTHLLNEKNYIPIESQKTRIVLGGTLNSKMNHVKGWKNRHNGNYKKTAAFTIDTAGVVFKHFDPKFQSLYFGNVDLDSKSIIILIENVGWLEKDGENNKFITWVGDIYKDSNEIVEVKWRNKKYWAPYNQKQIESAVELVKELTKEFNIDVDVMVHNTKVDDIIDFNGIIYKSNLDKNYTDLNPTWDCREFKQKVEK